MGPYKAPFEDITRHLLKVGLTGGIGCGKSTAVDAFRVLGAAIIDADQISKKLVEPGEDAYRAIVSQFGDEFLLQQGKHKGELNRALLKEKVFSDESLLKQLENILHPRIKKEIKKQIASLEALGQQPYVVIDVPLLVEKGYQDMFDRIVVVDCLPEQQLSRVLQRDALDEQTVKQIMQQQASRKTRLKNSTDILDNSHNKDDLIAQIKALHPKFLTL